MAIENRVINACRNLELGDAEGALHDICSAIEATCKRIYGTGGRTNYKDFIHDNLPLISRVGFGRLTTSNLYFGYTHPDVPQTPNGTSSFQDIVYHVVRCGLYHEAELPSTLHFHPETRMQCKDGHLHLPHGLILGLIVAIVVNPVNAGIKTSTGITFNYGEVLRVQLDQLWGTEKKIVQEFDAVDP